MLSIRPATIADAAAIAAIYAHYVEHTAITFECESPTLANIESRIAHALLRHVWLVAVIDDVIVGYAYAVALKERPACAHAVETSIYLSRDCCGRGVGRTLYTVLEQQLQHRGYTNLYASIAYAPDDPFVDDTSLRFHERMGYTLCGTMHACGRKFSRSYDLVWMEKIL